MAYSLFLLTLSCIVPLIHGWTKLSSDGLLEESKKVPGNSSILLDVHPYDGGVFVSLEYCEKTFGSRFTPYPFKLALQLIMGWLIPLLTLIGNIYMPTFTKAPPPTSKNAFQPKLSKHSTSESSVQHEASQHSISKDDTPQNPASEDAILHETFRHSFSEHAAQHEVPLQSSSERFINIWYFLAVTGHLLADPVDAIWSLLCKLDGRRKIYKHVIKVSSTDPRLDDQDVLHLATILFALDDYPDTHATDMGTVQALKDGFGKNRKIVRQAAKSLIDLHVKNTLYVTLAIAVYIGSIVSALEKSRKDPPIFFLHTIALRELYYWLLPAIVLSSIVGGFQTDRTSKWVLKDTRVLTIFPKFKLERLKPWNGGTYSFAVDKKTAPRKKILWCLAFGAVGCAWASAFLMNWISPTQGLECRGILQLSYGMAWGLNSTLNSAIYRKINNQEWKLVRSWKWIMVKDVVISTAMLLVLLLAFQGETCRTI